MHKFTIGQRVKFTQDFEIFPCDLIIRAGACGEIREFSGDKYAFVLMDENFPNLRDWDNAAQFDGDVGEDNGFTLQGWLNQYLEPTDEQRAQPEDSFDRLLASPIGAKLRAAGFSIWNSGGNIMLWGKEYIYPREKNKKALAYLAQQEGSEDGDLGEDGNENDWRCSFQDHDGNDVEEFNLDGTLDACLAFLAKFAPAYVNADEIAESAINHLAYQVQEMIGQTDGGCAGMFFSDDENREPIAEIIRRYIAHEAVHADERFAEETTEG